MAKTKKARTAEIVKILRQTYSTFKKGKSDSLTDIILLSALGEGRGETAAHAALAAIRVAFADWNEVRVSAVMELVPILVEAGIKQPVPRARALKSTVEEIYQKYNALTLDREQGVDSKNREKVVRRLRLADPAAVEAGLLFGFDSPVVTVGPAVQRVAKRLGILDSTTLGRMLKQITGEASPTNAPDLLHAYAIVAAEHCFIKDMDCEGCPLLSLCETGPKELERRERARVAAEKRRQVEEEKERKLAERRRKRMKDAVTKRMKSAVANLESAAASGADKKKKKKKRDKGVPASGGDLHQGTQAVRAAKFAREIQAQQGGAPAASADTAKPAKSAKSGGGKSTKATQAKKATQATKAAGAAKAKKSTKSEAAPRKKK